VCICARESVLTMKLDDDLIKGMVAGATLAVGKLRQANAKRVHAQLALCGRIEAGLLWQLRATPAPAPAPASAASGEAPAPAPAPAPDGGEALDADAGAAAPRRRGARRVGLRQLLVVVMRRRAGPSA